LTIAACCVSPEGVVLGADSTTTYPSIFGPHYYNHAQKLFEIGEGSSLGLVTWGLGGLGVSSHRMLTALLADDVAANAVVNVLEAANRWCNQFWGAYSSSPIIAPQLQACRNLAARPAFDPAANPQPQGARNFMEEQQFRQLREGLTTGFCIAGYALPDRTPSAFEIIFDPVATNPPTPVQIAYGSHKFWGVPRSSFGDC
jgi:hypothetical protein